MYIPDPVELMENRMEAQIDLIDKDGTYPCVVCGRRYPYEDMHPISVDPSASLECGMPDCHKRIRGVENA